MGTLPDGRKIFVWNALPGETVSVEVSKNKRDYAEGTAVSVVRPSSDRIEAKDEAYLSTSPWQILKFDAENRVKAAILTEQLAREKVAYDASITCVTDGIQWGYRNKMEYSFWGDETGLHLALFNRGTHGKCIVTGSSIAKPAIDKTANKVLEVLRKHSIRAGQLKTIIVRSNEQGVTAAALFVKDRQFAELSELQDLCQGIMVAYSNPKSPASVVTEELYRYGSTVLSEDIGGVSLEYDVNSFFQVNVPVFKRALETIQSHTAGRSERVIDMYAGVGSIGLAIGADVLVEVDSNNAEMALFNAGQTARTEVIQAGAEQSLDYIASDTTVVFDPPRAGLHDSVVTRLIEVIPPMVLYLSCNPATLARDLAKLGDHYTIESITAYNFFPRTPHIEALAVLVKK